MAAKAAAYGPTKKKVAVLLAPRCLRPMKKSALLNPGLTA
jgi:hypothetical protein